MRIIVKSCGSIGLWMSVVLLSSNAFASERTIRVTGVGQVKAPPDMATIYTGVVTQASDAELALAANNSAMRQIMRVLTEQQVAKKDIQTSSFNVSPEYERPPRGGRPTQKIIGYRVTNQVQVHVRNLPNLGEVLDALVSAGSNRVSGISFGIDDRPAA